MTPTSTCGWTRTAGRRRRTCSTPIPCRSWRGCCASTARSGSPPGSPRRSPGRRAQRPLRRSAELVELLYEAVPAASRRTGGHPAKRTFQALRIEVNGELEALAAAVPAAIDALAVGGRIVVLAYHSLEDRIVKRELAERARSRTPEGLPVELPGHGPELRLLTRGAERRATTRSPTTRAPPRCGCGPPNGSGRPQREYRVVEHHWVVEHRRYFRGGHMSERSERIIVTALARSASRAKRG